MFYIVEVLLKDGEKRKVQVFAGDRDTAILQAGQMNGGREQYDKVWCVYPWIEGDDSAEAS